MAANQVSFPLTVQDQKINISQTSATSNQIKCTCKHLISSIASSKSLFTRCTSHFAYHYQFCKFFGARVMLQFILNVLPFSYLRLLSCGLVDVE